MNDLGAALASMNLAPALAPALSNFLQLFLKWNRSINLSAARSAPEVMAHIVDSLHIVPHLRDERAAQAPALLRVLDVGAGGGFPSVVAAICLPDIAVTALEPVHKKHAFLRTAARELALTNLEARAERIEDHPARDYDIAMSRATFDLVEWLSLGLSRIHRGGLVLGFEAVPRDDVPPGASRHRYTLDDKSRAIVALRSEPS